MIAARVLIAVVALAGCRRGPAPPPRELAAGDVGTGDRVAPSIVLAGQVVDADGAPVGGADIALIGPEQEIVAHGGSDAEGRFRFPITPGRWGLSAHHAGATGSFLAVAQYSADARSLRITLGRRESGVVVHGRVAGAPPPPGTWLEIAPFSESDADLFAVAVRADGTFEALLPRGDRYFVSAVGRERAVHSLREGAARPRPANAPGGGAGARLVRVGAPASGSRRGLLQRSAGHRGGGRAPGGLRRGDLRRPDHPRTPARAQVRRPIEIT
jgi:hypothetical protein